MKKKLFFLGLSLAVRAGFGQSPPICFHAQNNVNTVSVGLTPSSIVSTDFNGDGIFDIAIANSSSNSISVLLGNGGGMFGLASTFSVGSQPSCIISGDFNNDGKSDLATANFSSNNVSILFGIGNGNFPAAVNYISLGGPQGIATGDFNNDGLTDLVVANSNSNNFSLLTGTGSSFNSAIYFTAGTGPKSIIASDFNSDGNLDIALCNVGSGNVSICTGDGAGSFNAPTNYSVGNSPSALISADFNGDLFLDLAVANYGSNNVSILKGSALGTFSLSNTINTSTSFVYMLTGPTGLSSFDYNNDSKLDLAISYGGSNCISVRFGTGPGSFGSSTEFETSTNPICIINKDINLDGKMDIVTANLGADNISLLLGSGTGIFCSSLSSKSFLGSTESASGDFNNDGNQDLAVISEFVGGVQIQLGDGQGRLLTSGMGASLAQSNFVSSIITADFNNDSKLDIAVAEEFYVELLYGYGNGSFSGAPLLFQAGTRPSGLASGDFNNDGILDIAVSNRISNDVSLLTGYVGQNNMTLFTSPVNFSSGGNNPSSITADDFNGDGRLDLAVTNYSSNNVGVLLGSSSGNFVPVVNFSTGLNPLSVKSADFNGDGNKDLVISNFNSNNLSVLLGTGTGSFLTGINYSVNSKPGGLCVGDFNMDSFLDLAVPNFSSNNISFLKGTGIGTFNTPINYTVGINPNSALSVDLNNDGHSDVVTTNRTSHNLSILLNGNPKVTFGGQVKVCLGNSVVIQANGASSYTWSTGAVSNTILVTPTSNTNYSLNAISYGYCSGSAVQSVSVSSIHPTITVNSGTICPGSSFTITPSGGSTYTYSAGSSVVTPTSNASYSVIGASSFGCLGVNTAISSASLFPLSAITISAEDSIICAGESTTLTANGANTYSWSSGSVNNMLVVSPVNTTSYVVTAEDINSCKNKTVFVLNVDVCAGIKSTPEEELQVIIYPNPNNGKFGIELTSEVLAEINISNVAGQIIYESKSFGKISVIDVADCTNGIYIIEIKIGDKISRRKLVKN